MTRGNSNFILSRDKILIIGKQKNSNDLDDNSKKYPVPDEPSKNDRDMIQTSNANSPKALAETINTLKLKFLIPSF
jgi:hypothetical protein